jgi:hypothetical protein
MRLIQITRRGKYATQPAAGGRHLKVSFYPSVSFSLVIGSVPQRFTCSRPERAGTARGQSAMAQPPELKLRCESRFNWRRGFQRAGVLGLLLVTGAVVAAVEVRPERWRWSNPLPHGNNILDLLVATDLAVQVGDAGAVYVQGTDERWKPALTGVTNYLRGVALMGNRLIAVGENGCVLWSDDGHYFQPGQVSPATSDWFEGVTASSQRAVAVGDNGAIYSSTDGVNWSKVTSGTPEWLRGVAFGGGVYVAVGENGKILRSSGGASWSSVASGTTAHLNRVWYLGSNGSGQFIAVGNNGVALSSVTGTAPWTSLNSGSTNNFYDSAINDTGWLLVGDNEVRFRAVGTSTWTNHITALPTNAPPEWVYLSAYGISNRWLVTGRTGMMVTGSKTNGGDYHWQLSPDSSHAWLWDVTVQKGIYVAVGDLATIQTSLDGILWAREVVPVPHTNTVLLGVGGNTNLLLAVGNAGNLLISRAGLTNLTITNYYGTNAVITNATFETLGLIWTQLPAFTTNSLQGVATAENRLVVAGEAGKVFTSPDGTNWTPRATPTTSFLTSVAMGPDACVAVGSQGTLLRAPADATTWTTVAVDTTNWLYRVRWLNQQFIVVGQNGAIFTSPDGTHWTRRLSGSMRWLTDAAFVNGQWFVTGYQGTLLTSSNLVNWTPLPLPTIKSLYAAATQNGQLVLAGIEGAILRNPIGPETTPVNLLGYDRKTVTSPVSAAGVYELFLFGGRPDQYFQLQSATNLMTWQTNGLFELFDSSGTIYLLRTRDLTNTLPQEAYRTALQP